MEMRFSENFTSGWDGIEREDEHEKCELVVESSYNGKCSVVHIAVYINKIY